MDIKSYKSMKNAIWLFFFLLIFEGGLRRWILPGLATPLLLVRDPIAIYLLYKAYRCGIFPKNVWVSLIILLGFISIFTALYWGHGNIFVAIFGARVLIIHVPVLFIIGKVFNKNDVLKMGEAVLWISIPMAILITIQFYSPQTDWVNRGVGNDLKGAGFSGSGEYFRPPGTFSFITGVSSFFSFAACYVFYFWINPHLIKKYLLIAGTIAIIVSIPTSISRTLFFQSVIVFLFFLLAKSSQPGFLKNILQIVFGIIVFLLIFSKVNFLSTQIDAFTDRFTTANEQEGGLNGVFVDRFLGGLVSSFIDIDDSHSFFGLGIGMGTNVGAQLLSGKTVFLISEGEWGRIIGETGILLGILIILFRIIMTYEISSKAIKAMRNGNQLPWMLFGYGFLQIFQGTWAQPNGLGFYVLIGGLIIGAFNTKSNFYDNKTV
jgi:hypothetical protein